MTDSETKRSERIADYASNNLATEIAALERGYDAQLNRFAAGHPDLIAALKWKPVSLCARHLQQLIWTCRRTFQRAVNTGPKVHFIENCSDSLPDFTRPAVYVDVTELERRQPTGGMRNTITGIGSCLETSTRGRRVAETGTGFVDASTRRPVEFADGDVLMILGPFWLATERYNQRAAELRLKRVIVVACIYDIIPLLYPMLSPQFYQVFSKEFSAILMVSDYLVSVTAASGVEIVRHIANLSVRPRAIYHGSFHIGHETLVATTPPSFWSIFATGRPVFLCVGTLEPKKGYDLVIDAFESLIDAGRDIALVIVGRRGWQCAALTARITNHPSAGRSLFWLEDISNSDLAYVYGQSSCLIQASVAEGFGLPIIEAAAFRLAVIASDIDVFREIAPLWTRFFAVADSQALARCMTAQLADESRPPPVESRNWQHATDDLLALLEPILSRSTHKSSIQPASERGS